MCGIVGIISSTSVVDRLVQGIKRLEYRGYDSTGIATFSHGDLHVRRTPGKIINLEKRLETSPLKGMIGIAHTRWATHGLPNETNAHPHQSDTVALVHNGIIENHDELRRELMQQGVVFNSETDTEVIVHLITYYLQSDTKPLQAVQKALQRLKGAYAIAVLFKDTPDLLIGARHGSPLAIGYGDNEMFLGSDAIALSGLAQEISYLEEGDLAVLSLTSAQIYDVQGTPVKRPIEPAPKGEDLNKGSFEHFMAKEIFEQPDVVRQTLSHYLNVSESHFYFPPLPFHWQDVPKITIVACGTAYYTGVVAKYWFEKVARIPVEVDIASEFRYRMPPLPKNGVALFISQSGETADTLAAFHYAKSQGQHCIGIVNVPKSSLARLVDVCLLTHAGVEIGVASTKAFTTQLTVLSVLALAAAEQRKVITSEEVKDYCAELARLPNTLEKALTLKDEVKSITQDLKHASNALYLGRGTSYAIALEGALKLKEISYIHAEAYAAGEIKHGPIALIDEAMPIIIIAPHDDLFEKTLSNVHEVHARQGRIIFLSDPKGQKAFTLKDTVRVTLPEICSYLSPILYTIPIQLLAYYTAVARGTDVDQPRNLAKSVTVE
ncbi:glutamine--fructose-6-phosphate transaminase (isomerizing) [Candidatus Nucleicultrix amoebiphila]|jgi:glucosamine--fructose-6-phosphate aminotransferase (isomerizing)|uniref:Glutamine--fructose-6-phosphate aminotransferase [isomerizing] n=1 Tax=Candidatus Nucleicultrix amoebiphila FS5 TaxID=1414854 RepID=A0A1W6N6Q7_9PROT|nr:glutamine--fructose-6-phosphate transaminase (isomerizing) [Candidatus Nucleicultrix amoebiphila]ARN85449.1 glucosamine--fructose-6-phosphate aminotransferase [Candidatus Nucleicultrix amoebiphila FS5]